MAPLKSLVLKRLPPLPSAFRGCACLRCSALSLFSCRYLGDLVGRVSWKHIFAITAGFALLASVVISASYERVLDISPSVKSVATSLKPPSTRLPIIEADCAEQLNAGSWVVPEGTRASVSLHLRCNIAPTAASFLFVSSQAITDPLQVGLADASSLVWKWSFGATKACGFGIKATKDVAAAVRGRCVCLGAVRPPPRLVSCCMPGFRWLLFMGDSQLRHVFRRLVESVSPILSKEFGSVSMNGDSTVDPANYPFFGHRDFELIWQSTSNPPVTTRYGGFPFELCRVVYVSCNRELWGIVQVVVLVGALRW